MIGGIDVAVSKVEKWKVTFNLTPENAEFTLKNLKQEIVDPISSGGGK